MTEAENLSLGPVTPPGTYNDHPFYADGWDDAAQGEPLFPDAAVEYAAGWRAWYVAKELFTRIGAPDA